MTGTGWSVGYDGGADRPATRWRSAPSGPPPAATRWSSSPSTPARPRPAWAAWTPSGPPTSATEAQDAARRGEGPRGLLGVDAEYRRSTPAPPPTASRDLVEPEHDDQSLLVLGSRRDRGCAVPSRAAPPSGCCTGRRPRSSSCPGATRDVEKQNAAPRRGGVRRHPRRAGRVRARRAGSRSTSVRSLTVLTRRAGHPRGARPGRVPAVLVRPAQAATRPAWTPWSPPRPAGLAVTGRLLDGPGRGRARRPRPWTTTTCWWCGSRGYGPVRRVLLGGVSSRVVRHAKVPVVVAPRGD